MKLPILKLSRHDKQKKFESICSVSEERLEAAFANPSGTYTINHALKRSNVRRNRYLNVFPYDQSRVKLPTKSTASGADYINASYVSLSSLGSQSKCCDFIAAQGPLPNTSHHFWAMAFAELERTLSGTIVVAMITPLVESGMVKCHQYWPDARSEQMDFSADVARDELDLPSLVVKFVRESLVGDYTLTELELQVGPIKKKVLHYYYYKWADARVPNSLDPLLRLSLDLEAACAPLGLVPIVHCSAGVGRTGTFMAIHYFLHNPDVFKHHKDPVYDLVLLMRKYRMMMVQTVYQYCYLYDAAQRIYEIQSNN